MDFVLLIYVYFVLDFVNRLCVVYLCVLYNKMLQILHMYC